MEAVDSDDELLRVDNDEGISMVIGSDEEELLNLSSPEPENKGDKSNEKHEKEQNTKIATSVDANKEEDGLVPHSSAEEHSATALQDDSSQNESVVSLDGGTDIEHCSNSVTDIDNIKDETEYENSTSEDTHKSSMKEDNMPETKLETEGTLTNDIEMISLEENKYDGDDDECTKEVGDSEALDEVEMINPEETKIDENNDKSASESVPETAKFSTAIESDNKHLNTSVEEDDDVIFEGITKCDNKENAQDNKDEDPEASSNSTNMKYTTEETESETETKADDELDDDVILEKIVKPENSHSKQNCDTKTNIQTNCDVNLQTSVGSVANDNDADSEARDQSQRKRPAEKLSNSNIKQAAKRSKLDLNGLSVKSKTATEPESIELSDSEEGETTSECSAVSKNNVTVSKNLTIKTSNSATGERLITLTEKVRNIKQINNCQTFVLQLHNSGTGR